LTNVRNRLARESSPYLLLHAENPVDWYPWGEEAFARAREDDKPIFLSVGYSTCYWCHVMERESFSNPEIARQMNEGFVSIKLDREERPDLDEIYMTATQLITRSGGWPNSLFLTHDLKPFFAGTYFPPRDGLGRPGFPRVLAALREAWELRRDEVRDQAEEVTEAMREQLGAGTAEGGLPEPGLGEETQAALAQRFDGTFGGFGRAPKFPSPSNLFFLLDRAREGDGPARDMLLTTLDGMARGGIHDHLGGGFHRYSTDTQWLVPHFEKMLYDNAALAVLYAEAAPLAPAAGFEGVARSVLAFVLHELTGPEGGFLSAIDAETEGHEGAYYTWTKDELLALLPGDDRKLFTSVYGLDGPPTFETDRYVLHLSGPLAESARAHGLSEGELRARLEPGRRALLEARGKRPRPLVDDKVLADWNGLMIEAMARGGERLAERAWVDVARRAADFVLTRLRDPEGGTLLHAWREGRARIPAFLDDYAFVVSGLLALHAVTGEERWQAEAILLAAEQERRLGDPAGGYFAAGQDPRLLFRAKPAYDGAVASGNGVAALNLTALGQLTGDASFLSRAEGVLRAFGGAMSAMPLAHVSLVRAWHRWRATPGASTPARSAPVATEALEDTARDVVEVSGQLTAGPGPWRPFVVELAIRPGWHLNAHPASLPSLVATSLGPVLGQLRGLRYPAGEPFGPATEPISVYRGRVMLVGEIEPPVGGAPSLELTYQACDDRRCLPPVTRLVRLR
jgi:uncharacterized protein YyaL (SSP411 family)